jgi:hypothetical protein
VLSVAAFVLQGQNRAGKTKSIWTTMPKSFLTSQVWGCMPHSSTQEAEAGGQ